MYCNHCGAPIAPDQWVCSACGRSPVESRVAAVTRSRVPEHLHLLAIFWFVVGALTLIPVAIMFALASITRVAIPPDAPPIAHAFGPLIFTAIGGFLLLVAAANLITAWGLYKTRPWGRMLALVMGFIALLHPPFGTALGIYTLFVLLPGEAGAEYARLSGSAQQRAVGA